MNDQDIIFTNDICGALSDLTRRLAHDRLFLLFDVRTLRCCMPVMADFLNAYDAAQVARGGAKSQTVIIEHSDTAKTVESLTEVWQALSDGHATRHSLLLNVGGGMLTDLGGFAAATFKRGIRFVNVATTLLGAVDAAVGGKTGVNLGDLKNEVGAFAPATAVVISTRFFDTLDRENLLSGYAEMLKHGLLDGRATLDALLAFDLEARDMDALLPLVEQSVGIKRRVVRQDPYEQGLRKALNLGHTVGHALETWCLRTGRPVLHGYAVAWGLVAELVLSHQTCGFPSETLYRIAHFVRDHYGALAITCDDYDMLFALMRHDKKNEGSAVCFTLMHDVGQPALGHTANRDEVGAALDIYRDLMGI